MIGVEEHEIKQSVLNNYFNSLSKCEDTAKSPVNALPEYRAKHLLVSVWTICDTSLLNVFQNSVIFPSIRVGVCYPHPQC